MFNRKLSSVLLFGLVFGLVTGCGGESDGGEPENEGDPSSGSNGGNSGSSTPSMASLNSGDEVVFLARSASSSDVMNIGGQSITLESGAGYIYRYIPSTPALDRFESTYDATNNYSCEGAGAQKPYTSGQSLFNIEVCPNYGGGYSIVDVESVNPNNGELLGYTCNLNLSGTSQVSIEISLIGDYLYYVDSSGDLKKGLPDCSTPQTLLVSGDSNNSGTFYGIDDRLISVLNDFANDRYVIREHDLNTGVITNSSLAEIAVTNSNHEHYFFEGDDALYWVVYHRDDYTMAVYRYAPSASIATIYSITLSDAKTGFAVDASGGKVLISYEYVASRTSSGYATAWNQVTLLYDVAQDSFATLDLNNNFEQSLQYLIYQ